LAALAPDSSRPRRVQPRTAHRIADRAEAATGDTTAFRKRRAASFAARRDAFKCVRDKRV